MPAPILPLIEAVAHWPERGALIGLDLGTKTIGVAASDPDRRLATGVETIQRKAFKADAALLPVFFLIVLGFILKRTLIRPEAQWHGLERLTYYVLFPLLLIQTLVRADLTKVPVAGVGGALLLSALAMSLLCLALRPLLARA